jgi:hypothetical protein
MKATMNGLRLVSQRLMLAGLTVERLSLCGLYRRWGFMLFAVGGVRPIVAGVALYVAGAVRWGQPRRPASAA